MEIDKQKLEIMADRLGEQAQARKKAVALCATLRTFAQGVHNTGSMLEHIAGRKILAGEPLSFNAFWGVGGKRVPDSYDQKLLSELEAIMESVASVYPNGAEIQLMLADEHGQFNHFKNPCIYEYLVRIHDLAQVSGIKPVWLSELYGQWNLEVPDMQLPPDPLSPAAPLWRNPKYFRQRDQLIESARRHNQSAEDPELIAYRYALMRLQEAPFLVRTFPESIILANTSKELGRLLLPEQLPHIYLRNAPVWFLEEKKI